MRYVLTVATLLIFAGIVQADEIRVRQADYWRGRPIATHRAEDYESYSQPRRMWASPYGWTSREPISRRESRRLEHRRHVARRYYARQLSRRYRR